MLFRSKLLAFALSVAACIAATPAQSSLIAFGITYTLYYHATPDPNTDSFELLISGINGPSDTELGRYGVQSFAFNPPTGFVSATAPTGFSEMSGGLSASGCNGSGNFFCFYTNTAVAGPPLPANSSLSYFFTVATSTPFPIDYDPSFKINWEGSKNNYDLVSKTLTPTPGTLEQVPEPATLLLVGIGLVAAASQRRKRG
jgi:hypothetical protein